jgi:hypothetical protein
MSEHRKRYGRELSVADLEDVQGGALRDHAEALGLGSVVSGAGAGAWMGLRQGLQQLVSGPFSLGQRAVQFAQDAGFLDALAKTRGFALESYRAVQSTTLEELSAAAAEKAALARASLATGEVASVVGSRVLMGTGVGAAVGAVVAGGVYAYHQIPEETRDRWDQQFRQALTYGDKDQNVPDIWGQSYQGEQPVRATSDDGAAFDTPNQEVAKVDQTLDTGPAEAMAPNGLTSNEANLAANVSDTLNAFDSATPGAIPLDGKGAALESPDKVASLTDGAVEREGSGDDVLV